MLLLSRKGFKRNLYNSMEERWKGLGVLNIRRFPFPPPLPCPEGGTLAVWKEERKLWGLDFYSLWASRQGVPGFWICLWNVCMEQSVAVTRCSEKSVAQEELRTIALESGCLALSGTCCVALDKLLDLGDSVSSSHHVFEWMMMNISQVWYKG